MIGDKKVVVVMPAYNAEKTIKKTVDAIPKHVVDEIMLVDDASSDATSRVAKELGIRTFTHVTNKGYGANQKTCYYQALELGADIVVMLHPDYQYNPKLIPSMASLIAEGVYDAMIGSRILGTGALKGGMPVYKYISNRFLTLVENWMIGQKVSEFHTGYRAFSKKVLETLPLLENSDDFVFDNQMLLQTYYFGFNVGELSCPTVYNSDSSSINFSRSVVYGLGVLNCGLEYMLSKAGIKKSRIFDPQGKTLLTGDKSGLVELKQV